MKTIRKGSDIVVRWRIFRYGQEYDIALYRESISLVLSNMGEKKEITDYSIVDVNTIVFKYRAEDQGLGIYRLLLIDKSRNSTRIIEECNAFRLVNTSDAANNDGTLESAITITLTSELTAPADGLSAYEVALQNGFIGTEEEWLQSLVPDTTDIELAEAQRQAKELERIEAENTRQSAELERQNASTEAVSSANGAATNANNAATTAQQKAEEANTAASSANAVVEKFNSIIVQETGNSQDKVMSQKAVTDAMTASQAKLSELDNNVSNITNAFVEDENGDINFVDKNGNIAFSITKDGVKAGRYTLIKPDGTEIELTNEDDGSDVIVKDEDGNTYLVDAYGNIAVKIDKKGNARFNKFDNSIEDLDVDLSAWKGDFNAFIAKKDGKYVYGGFSRILGKNVLQLCDSLGNSIFPDYLGKIANCNVINGNYGGTRSYPRPDDRAITIPISQQDRLLWAFKDKKIRTAESTLSFLDFSSLDCLIFENVNDFFVPLSEQTLLGTISDKAWMVSRYIDIDTHEVSIAGAKSYIDTNFSTIVNNAITSMSDIFEIRCSSEPSSNGVVNFSLGGHSYTVAVNIGMKRLSVCDTIRDAILEYTNEYAVVTSCERCFITSKNGQSAKVTNISSTVCSVTSAPYYRGSIINAKYSQSSKKLTFSGTPSNGVFTIHVGDTDRATTISSNMTLKQAVAEISLWEFQGYNVSIEDETSLVFVKTDISAEDITYDVGTTGLNISVLDVSKDGYVYKYFFGTNDAEFRTADKWSYDHPTMYATWKGMIEFAQIVAPMKRKLVLLPTAYQCKFYESGNTVTDDYGYLDFDKFLKENKLDKAYKELFKLQKEVATYYNVECVELWSDCGVNLLNMQYFYPYNGGVHPSIDMDKLWAIRIYEQLK